VGPPPRFSAAERGKVPDYLRTAEEVAFLRPDQEWSGV
jgi:hypothetical protein